MVKGEPMWGVGARWVWLAQRPQVDLSELPSRLDLGPSRLAGAAFLVIAAVCGYYGLEITTGLDATAPGWTFAMTLPLPGLALAMAGAALWSFTVRRRVTFDGAGLEVEDRSLLGRATWFMSYADYRGVRHYEKVVRGRRRSTTYQVVELFHPEKARRIPLHVSTGGDFPREELEAYAKAFRLPTLVKTPDGLVERRSDDLDTPLKKRVAAGRMTPDERYNEAPPRGLRLARETGPDERIRVRIAAGRYPAGFVAVIFLILAVMAVYGAVQPAAQAFGLVAGACLLGFAGLVWWDRRQARELVITKEQIRVADPLAWSRPDPDHLPLDAIEEVRLHRTSRKLGNELMIESDAGTIAVGQGLSKKALKWLRSLIVSAVATA